MDASSRGWIAHVKELNGLIVKSAPNRQSPTSHAERCPEDMRPLIEASLRRLGMLFEGLAGVDCDLAVPGLPKSL